MCVTLSGFQCSADLNALLVTGLNFPHLYLDSRLFPQVYSCLVHLSLKYNTYWLTSLLLPFLFNQIISINMSLVPSLFLNQ